MRQVSYKSKLEKNCPAKLLENQERLIGFICVMKAKKCAKTDADKFRTIN